ncbi:MAG: hypothetical protein ABIN36_12140 [Ferruginibacter sp.]
MKKPFLAFILFIFCSSLKAQTELFGQYKFHSENGEVGTLNLNCSKTFLMEDKIFVTRDSSFVSIVKGTWKVQKSKLLILIVDSIVSQPRPVGNLKRIEYLILNGRFYLKLPNKKQYEKQNKNLYKKYPEDLPGAWEDYETYKMKQNNRYFFIADVFNCR